MRWNFYYKYLIAFVAIIFAKQLFAETMLQKEQLSFAKCLEVIETASQKLAVPKNITVDESNLRVVSFEMSDGKLIIKCDGNLEEITVFSAQSD